MNTRRFQSTRISTNRTGTTEPMPVLLVPTSINETNNAQPAVRRLNPKNKRNLRANRRATGIRPDDLSTISTQSDESDDDQGQEEFSSAATPSTNRNHSESNETIAASQPVFTVSRIQSTFDKLSINRPDNPNCVSSSNLYGNSTGSTNRFRTEEFIIRRQPSEDDSSTMKTRQLEERLRHLEALVYDKDLLIHDLQRKLDQTIRDLSNAEEEIYNLHKEKLTLIKAFSTLQETKSSSSSYVSRN